MELKPLHSAVFRKTGDGPWTVKTFDLSKAREPKISLWRLGWLRLTAPYRARQYRRMFEKGIVIVRSDQERP